MTGGAASTLRAAIIGALGAALALLSAGTVSADHRVYFAEDNSSRTYAIDHWAINGTTITWCSDDNTFYNNNIIGSSYIEGLHTPAVHWTQNCGSTSVWIRSYTTGSRCSQAAGGCITRYHRYNATRQGDYVYAADIWLNDQNWNFYDLGRIAVVHHELGHLHGLEERYHHSGSPCNNSETTIMDAAVGDGIYILGGCDGYLPTDVLDRPRELAFYDLVPVRNFLLLAPPTNAYFWQWEDVNWAEASYKISHYYWNGSSWQYIRTDDHATNVARGRPTSTGYLSMTFYRPSGWPAGYYTSCFQTYNRLYGAKHWLCTPNKYLF